jgi:nucleotide-binding universal stress UspA family protein
MRGPTRFHSLLVAIDLTPSSDRVLGRVSRLPLADDAEVTILHVVPGSLTATQQRDAERDADAALASEALHLRKSLPQHVRIHRLVKRGGAAEEIGACATKLDAELIVMGRGSGRALRDAFLGSTAERVVRQARIPVLVVRLAARATYKRPALALDLDQAAHEVVRLLLRVLPAPRPRVAIIHAYEIPYRGLIYPSLSADEADKTDEEFRLAAHEDLAGLLATALAEGKVRPEDTPPWKLHVWHGSPLVVVERVMKKVETDLLVLGTRGHSGAAYLFLGTVAGELLRQAKCDVLVVPPASSRRRSASRVTKGRGE